MKFGERHECECQERQKRDASSSIDGDTPRCDRDELIPILTDVNHELGYIPQEAIDEVSRLIGMPQTQLSSVASFYEMLCCGRAAGM